MSGKSVYVKMIAVLQIMAQVYRYSTIRLVKRTQLALLSDWMLCPSE